MLSKSESVMLETIVQQFNLLSLKPGVNLPYRPLQRFNCAVVNICEYVDDSEVILVQVLCEIFVVFSKVCAWNRARRIVATINN